MMTATRIAIEEFWRAWDRTWKDAAKVYNLASNRNNRTRVPPPAVNTIMNFTKLEICLDEHRIFFGSGGPLDRDCQPPAQKLPHIAGATEQVQCRGRRFGERFHHKAQAVVLRYCCNIPAPRRCCATATRWHLMVIWERYFSYYVLIPQKAILHPDYRSKVEQLRHTRTRAGQLMLFFKKTWRRELRSNRSPVCSDHFHHA